MADLNQSYDSAKSQINSIKSYKDIYDFFNHISKLEGYTFNKNNINIANVNPEEFVEPI